MSYSGFLQLNQDKTDILVIGPERNWSKNEILYYSSQQARCQLWLKI